MSAELVAMRERVLAALQSGDPAAVEATLDAAVDVDGGGADWDGLLVELEIHLDALGSAPPPPVPVPALEVTLVAEEPEPQPAQPAPSAGPAMVSAMVSVAEDSATFELEPDAPEPQPEPALVESEMVPVRVSESEPEQGMAAQNVAAGAAAAAAPIERGLAISRSLLLVLTPAERAGCAYCSLNELPARAAVMLGAEGRLLAAVDCCGAAARVFRGVGGVTQSVVQLGDGVWQSQPVRIAPSGFLTLTRSVEFLQAPPLPVSCTSSTSRRRPCQIREGASRLTLQRAGRSVRCSASRRRRVRSRLRAAGVRPKPGRRARAPRCWPPGRRGGS